MTHDEMTAALRGEDWPVFDPEDHHEIADRLDRYRDLIKRLSYSLPATEVFRYLHRDIREALK